MRRWLGRLAQRQCHPPVAGERAGAADVALGSRCGRERLFTDAFRRQREDGWVASVSGGWHPYRQYRDVVAGDAPVEAAVEENTESRPTDSGSNAHHTKAPMKSLLPLLPILMLSACLNLWNNEFPVGYHFDEPKKARFLETHERDFRHPILMLNAVGVALWATGAKGEIEVVRTGRDVSACFGVALVLFFHLLVRGLLPPRWGWLATLAVAVSPILVIHAHYLKEDVFFAPWAVGL